MVISHKQKEDKQKQIIRAAAEVFAKKGFARTVMADIALQAGIGKGTTYEYFKSKEDLFFAVFQWISKVIPDLLSLTLITRWLWVETW